MTSDLLSRWRSLAGEGADPLGEALIRAWDEPQRVYHDQSHSADWARTGLAHSPELATRVADVIAMTKNHAEGEASGDAALFLDMDIAILGAPWETYCAYAAGIRREYPHIVDPAFAAGRGAFLEKQLQHTRTFRTDFYESELGETARTNMRWEFEEMRKGRMVKG